MTQPSKRTFNEEKAAEVAFYFLSKARGLGRNITKLRFIKWMYLAERLSYENFGEPLIGDKLFSMQHGPVASETLYLIEQPHMRSPWDKVVRTEHGKRHQYLTISDDCVYEGKEDLRSLSDSEIDILEEVWARYGHMSARDLESLLHDQKKFPEWQWRMGDGSNPIALEELLPILGYDGDQTLALIKRLQVREAMDWAFSH